MLQTYVQSVKYSLLLHGNNDYDNAAFYVHTYIASVVIPGPNVYALCRKVKVIIVDIIILLVWFGCEYILTLTIYQETQGLSALISECLTDF
jgi:hypothetical protein